jgi:hypothetical protein
MLIGGDRVQGPGVKDSLQLTVYSRALFNRRLLTVNCLLNHEVHEG